MALSRGAVQGNAKSLDLPRGDHLRAQTSAVTLGGGIVSRWLVAAALRSGHLQKIFKSKYGGLTFGLMTLSLGLCSSHMIYFQPCSNRGTGITRTSTANQYSGTESSALGLVYCDTWH